MRPPREIKQPKLQVLPLSEARKKLSLLLKSLVGRPGRMVGIAVHGNVKGYLVHPSVQVEMQNAQRLARRARPRKELRGALKEVLAGIDVDEALAEVKAETERYVYGGGIDAKMRR